MIKQATRKHGIYTIPAAEYHRDTFAVSASMLKTFAADRVEFRRKYVTEYEATEASAAMNLGSFIHAAVLEPETIADQFAIIPEQYATQKGLSTKADAKAWAFSNGNKVLLTADDAARGAAASASIQGLLRETFGSDWRDQFNAEQSIYWEESGIAMRARLDLVHKDKYEGKPLIIDIKSCTDSSESAFARQCSSLFYWMQVAHYSKAYEQHYGETPQFWFLAQETDGSYSPAYYELTPEDYEKSVASRLKYIGELMQCRASGDWRNVRSKNTVSPIKLGFWAFGENHE